MHRAAWNDNKVSLHATGQPLGVECLACCRRALAFADERDRANLRGSMTLLSKLKFVCSGCGGRDVQLWLFHDRLEVERFSETPLGGPEF